MTLAPSETEQRKAEIEGKMNWFGEAVGSNASGESSPAIRSGVPGGSVGKYLKRAREAPAAGEDAEDQPKKRKVGWGNFEGW
jgi:hypothetical protein